ncbi:Amidase domain-containing protein [Plasmodiophora brassicae]
MDVKQMHAEIECAETSALVASAPPYQLDALKAPRLAGWPLKAMAWAMTTPGIGSLLSVILFKQNRMSLPTEFANRLPLKFIPMAYPDTGRPHSNESESGVPLDTWVQLQQSEKRQLSSQSDFRYWTTGDFVQRYKDGRATPTTVIKSVLGAIDKLNPTLKAFTAVNAEDALAQAEASTKRYQAGAPLGPLDGIPIAVKDEVDVAGYMTTFGTLFVKEVPSCDDPCITRLRAAGAIIIGKTNMHELGLGTTGCNLHHGTARNPYDSARYPGGSSSGSAASVASGLVPIAVACDGGGSIRIPSALTGQFGLKATFDRIAHKHGFTYSVGHVGPIASSLADLAIAFAVMSGVAALPNTDVPLPRLKIGVFRPHFENADTEIVQRCREVLDTLARHHGAEIVDITIPFLNIMTKAHVGIISSEILRFVERYPNPFSELSPELRISLSLTKQFTAQDLLAAQQVRAFATDQIKKIFKTVDIMATPVTSVTAHQVPNDVTTAGESDVSTTSKIMTFAPLANLVGHPSISIPVGCDSSGMPIGMQFEADFWKEDILVHVAAVVEKSVSNKLRRRPKEFISVLSD